MRRPTWRDFYREFYGLVGQFQEQKQRISELEAENRRMREALRSLVGYCTWQIKEGADHHPTLPSAVEAARAALSQEEKP